MFRAIDGISLISDLRITHRRPHESHTKSSRPGRLIGTIRFFSQHRVDAIRSKMSFLQNLGIA